MRTVMLVARREIAARLQQKGFRIGLLLSLVVIALAAAAPGVFGSSHRSSYDVGVASGAPAGLSGSLETVAKAQDVQLHVRRVASVAEARHAVDDGDLDAAVVDGRLVVKKTDVVISDIVQQAYREAGVLDRLTRAGLSGQQAGEALRVAPLPVEASSSGQNVQRQVLASVIVVFLFAQLTIFVTWTGMGVVEEKTSRVVELLLATVRPRQLLAGKLLGIGALAVGQAVLVGGVALAAGVGTGSLDLPPSAYGTLLIGLLWFVLGFGFFAALAAGLASLVSRQEEVSSVLTPVTMVLLVCYGAGFAAASSPDTALARIASIVPPFSVITMPARLARGGTPWYDAVGAVVLMIVVTLLIVGVAARVYRAAVLQTGGRLSLRTAWRAEPAAEAA